MSSLHISALFGDAELTQALLNEGHNVDVSFEPFGTPLYTAASQGFYAVAEILISKGANVNYTSEDDGSVLFSAVNRLCNNDKVHSSDYGTKVGKVELLALVKLLLESGAHPDTATPEGVTPLNFSTAKGDVSLVKLLLKHGADINTPNGIGITPLFRAIQDGSEEIFQAFLFANPNLSTRCLNNSTLLHAAARGENDTILSTLLQKLDAHRNKDVRESSISVDTTNDAGEAPLHIAAERGCVKVARTLLTHGANIDLRDNAYVTPLIEAMSHEREDMVNFLKSQGANLSIVHEFRFLKMVDDPGKRAILYVGQDYDPNPIRVCGPDNQVWEEYTSKYQL